jgi:hypothetical protein
MTIQNIHPLPAHIGVGFTSPVALDQELVRLL